MILSDFITTTAQVYNTLSTIPHSNSRWHELSTARQLSRQAPMLSGHWKKRHWKMDGLPRSLGDLQWNGDLEPVTFIPG